MKDLIKMVKNGEKIMIIDGDGPWSSEYPEGLELTWDMLNEKIKDPTRPFGHGYVVATVLYALTN